MTRNKKALALQSDEQCEKQQEIEPIAPRRKKIIKKTMITRSSAKDQAHLLDQQPLNPDLQPLPIQFICVEENNHICPICLDLMTKAVTTVCGHSYCEFCLSQYLLFFEECLQCSKTLRSSKFSYNRVLDTLVETVANSLGTETKKDFENRWEESVKYAQNKKVTSLEVGDEVDVRDKDYVWCKGRIYRTICRIQQNRTKYVFINYLGKPRSCNQELNQNSERLAAPGFYTSREDIPRYQRYESGDLKLKSHLVFRDDEGGVMMEQERLP